MSLAPTSRSTSSERSRSVWMYAPVPSDSAVEFGERNNLHAWALPFRGHTIDPVELIDQFGEYLSGRPGGCQRVSRNVLQTEIDVGADFTEDPVLLENAMFVHGWWRGGKTATGLYFCNPDYYHHHGSDAITDMERRATLIKRATAMGVIDSTMLGPAVGYRSEGQGAGRDVLKLAERLDIDWSARRQRGKETMARTWKTLSDWDLPQREIGEAFDINQSTVSRWIQSVPDFDPPDDPTVAGVKLMQSAADRHSTGGGR